VATIADLRRSLLVLKSPSLLQKINRELAREAVAEVQRGFDRRASPYGVPWRPTKRRNPILEKTGALRRGIKPFITNGKLELRATGSAAKYAAFHQYGTRKMPARKFLPDSGQLPPVFEKSFGRVLDGIIGRLLKG